MGFADKFSSGSTPSKKKRAPAFPDTEFGTRMPPPGAGPAEGDEASPLTITNLFGRKHEQEAEDDALDTPLPMIGHLSLPRQLRILLMVMAIGTLMTLFSLWRNSASSAVTSGLTQVASEALMHSQRIGKAAPNAVRGNVAAFAQLEDSRNRLNDDLRLLAAGGTFDGRKLPAAGGQAARMVGEVRKKWGATYNAASTIISHKAKLTSLDSSLQQINKQSPEMTKLLEAVLEDRLARGASPREAAQLGRLMMITQRISKNATDFLTAGVVRTSETAFDLGRDIETFRKGIESLGGIEGDALRQRFTAYKAAVDVVLGNLTDFTRAKGAEQSIFYENEELKALLTEVQERFRNDQESTALWFWLMVASGVFTLATAGGVSRVLLQDSRNRTRGAEMRRQEAEELRARAQSKEEEAKATNDQNQTAILRLMNELQEVADGDLTIHATVSEDITGAIADSVNYTVEELRGLVGRVTRTAEQVTTASNNAQKISTDLLVAAKQQSREIENASATVLRMASEITDVSRSASRSADVARQSVAAASQGSNAVEKTIVGMQEIRDQIQETSKRIKRLGESSQEIGEITALISDITEQTNVLALNAAIQAASAGEAGRGFSVVAEEVQRLAERSGEAAKQIGALVRTIQTDTHDAVAAMEKSTQGVVEGAKLSDAAGAALSEISRVSNQLAELIQEISHATGRQATSANGVANDMGHILTITQNTQKGTQQTVLSIRQLSLLAQELKNSVARFRVA